MSLTLPAFAVTLSALVLSQGVGPGPAPVDGAGLVLAGGDPVGTPPVFIPPPKLTPVPVGPAAVTAIVNSLDAARQYCGAIKQQSYAIDCLAERLDNVSRRMVAVEGYGDVRATLDQAARGLNRIARDNASDSAPRAVFGQAQPDGSTLRTSRPLVPVDSARMDRAVSEALAVIDAAETVLLRSAETSAARAAQYQRIAEAVGSNKLLLRSL